MHVDEIELPDDTPEWEWVRGRALQKMSPAYAHAKLQFAFARALTDWAGDRGEVGTEWRFRIAPPGEIRRPLVPDVSYLASEKFAPLEDKDYDYPPVPPDIVVEVLSPRDRGVDVDAKRRDYLAAGTALVIIVDPRTKTVRTYETGDRDRERTFAATDTLVSDAFPDLALDLGALFATVRPRPTR